jgi:hypothetical protein
MSEIRTIRRLFGRVLGRLTDTSIDVVLTWHPTITAGPPTTVPIELIPRDLRTPNCGFVVVLGERGPERVVRYDPALVPEAGLPQEWFYELGFSDFLISD